MTRPAHLSTRSKRSRPTLIALVLALLLLPLAALAAEEDVESLVGRLLAPCCYKQTLDVHASDLADKVRIEIRKRMAAGESAASVEADMVARYGEKIRAIPHANFLEPIGKGLLAAAAVALVALFVFGRRRLVAKAPAEGPAPAATEVAKKELARELAELES